MSEHKHGDGHQHEAFTLEGGHWGAGFWDDRYSSTDALWSGKANAAVVAEAADLAPGRALDVGCGEGGDALWLAARGWEVLGVDVSQVALDRAAEHARAGGPDLVARTRWEQRDLLTWAPPAAAFDLVTVPFFHLPADVRPGVYAALAGAVAPAGTLLVVAHSPSDIGVVPRPPQSDLFFTAAEAAADLGPGWEIQVLEDRPRTAKHPETGEQVILHDAVLRARRQG